jgi:hypothetical protein
MLLNSVHSRNQQRLLLPTDENQQPYTSISRSSMEIGRQGIRRKRVSSLPALLSLFPLAEADVYSLPTPSFRDIRGTERNRTKELKALSRRLTKCKLPVLCPFCVPFMCLGRYFRHGPPFYHPGPCISLPTQAMGCTSTVCSGSPPSARETRLRPGPPGIWWTARNDTLYLARGCILSLKNTETS